MGCLGAVSLFRRQSKALEFDSTVFPHINLQYLVGEVAILREFVQDQSKDLPLQVQVQAKWRIDADQAGVQAHVRVFARRAWFIRRPAKVGAVIGNECPVAFQNDALEFPVFGACLAEMVDVRTQKAPLLCVGRQLRAQVFVDQDFRQTSSLLMRSYEVASWKLRPTGSWTGADAVDGPVVGSLSRTSKPIRSAMA